MRHSLTVPGAMPLLLALVGVLLLSPVAVHAGVQRTEPETLPAFYARMLAEHEGVFVEEELAGVFDRHEVAEDLRAQMADHEFDNTILVIGDPAHKLHLDELAQGVSDQLSAPVLVLSPNTNHVGTSHGRPGGIPMDAVRYAYYTGSRPADPRDQLASVLRATQYRNLDERTAVAEVEYEVLLEGRYQADPSNDAVPGFPTQRWLAAERPFTAALVSGVLIAWTAVALTTGFVRLWRARLAETGS